MIEETAQWGDLFPEINYSKTQDVRVFQTPYITVQENTLGMLSGIKKKTYFACIVGKDCYGVDIFRQKGVNSAQERARAFEKVQKAADYYEETGTWPR